MLEQRSRRRARLRWATGLGSIVAGSLWCTSARADGDPEPSAATATDLANQLANPVANLVSIPLQSNFEGGMGLGDRGFRYLLNVQPVVPIALGADWLVIARVIAPFVYQDDVVGPQDPEGASIAGMSDTLASLFLVPPELAGLIVGVGPAFSIPTSTDARLGAGHFGVGPAAVLLWQGRGVTLGALANHLFATTDQPDDTSQTFLQPFASYVFTTSTTVTLQTETTYEWHSNVWTVPLIAGASQLVHAGPLPLSFGIFGKWYVEGPQGAPDWGVRAIVTALIPTAS